MPSPPAPAPSAGRTLTATLAASAALSACLQTAVVPLVPDISSQLEVGTAAASWTLTANLLASAVLAPVLGRISDLRGRRSMILLCLAAVIAGSVLCLCFKSLPMLVLGRVLQGAGGALYTLAVSLVREELPSERVPGTTAAITGALGVGVSIGVVLAGVMTAMGGDYRLVFVVPCAAAVVILVSAPRTLPDTARRSGGRVDWWGAVLLGGTLVSWLTALSQGPTWGWTSVAFTGAVCTGAVTLVAFVAVELRLVQPLVDLRELRGRQVLLINGLALLGGALIIVSRLPVSQFVQTPPSVAGYGFGASVMTASLVYLMPGLLTAMGGSVLDGRLVKRYGGHRSVIVGGSAGLFAYLSLALMHDGAWQVITASAVTCAAVSIGASALPVVLARHVPSERFGAGNGLNALSRWIGSSVASAALGVLLSPDEGKPYPRENAYAQVFSLGAAASAMVVLGGFLIRNKSNTDHASQRGVRRTGRKLSSVRRD